MCDCYGMTKNYTSLKIKETDEERAMWWWLFRFYGADEALRLVREWSRL